MLEPHGRTLLFDILKPPEGHTLDMAIATTYTLDLLALLTAPVAFSLFDVDDHNDLLKQDSLTLLESLSRYADKLTVFCHASQIGLPKAQFPQLEFLEKCVVECTPTRRTAAFHPKIWVLRFIGAEGGVTYRLVCLTRNLTFDRCWDTVLTLEGPLLERQRAIAVNHPLGEFVKALPAYAVRGGVDEVVRGRIATIESEVRRVKFDVPEGFDSYLFHPIGIEGIREFPFDDRPGRMLIVFPFVSDARLQRLLADRQQTLLVSRPESLEQPGCRFDSFTKTFVLSRGTEDEQLTPEAESTGIDLTRGLHAKCYVIDAGWKAHVFTGSANATGSAFNGNVEFLVELVGPKSRFGIEALFGREEGKTCLGDMLEEFTPQPKPIDQEEEGIRAAIERIRQILITAQFVATVAESNNQFELKVEAKSPLELEAGTKVVCWPVTLGRGFAAELPSGGRKATVRRLSFEAITSFVAFEVTVGQRSEVFVLNLPLTGAPADRRQRLLHSFIKDRKRLLRFLFFLLADDAELADAMGTALPGVGTPGTGEASRSNGALLESLLRTLHRSPARLDAVARLIADLRKQRDGDGLFPPNFDEVWGPIWAVREGLSK